MTRMNLSMKQKWTHREIDLRWPSREKGRGRMGLKFGISRCKLFYTEWIKNKVLLYSSGNYIRYPGINHNGNKYEKEYICITESHFCIV